MAASGRVTRDALGDSEGPLRVRTTKFLLEEYSTESDVFLEVANTTNAVTLEHELRLTSVSGMTVNIYDYDEPKVASIDTCLPVAGLLDGDLILIASAMAAIVTVYARAGWLAHTVVLPVKGAVETVEEALASIFSVLLVDATFAVAVFPERGETCAAVEVIVTHSPGGARLIGVTGLAAVEREPETGDLASNITTLVDEMGGPNLVAAPSPSQIGTSSSRAPALPMCGACGQTIP